MLVEHTHHRTATVALHVGQGSAQEPPGLAGATHLLEHVMLRAPRPEHGAEDAHAAADALGARLEGGTDQDGVTYYVSVPAERTAEARSLLLAIASEAEFSDADVDAERAVVLQELARTRDDARESAHDLLYTAAFGAERLGRPVLGSPETVRAIGADDLRDLRDELWAEGEYLLVAAGGLGKGYPASGVLPEPFESPPLPFAPRCVVRTADLEQSYLRFWYEVPSDDEVPAARAWALATVYATLLGGSLGSRLARELRHHAGICYALYAHPLWHRDAHCVRLMMAVDPASAGEAVGRTLNVITALARDGAPADEVKRAKAVARGEFLLDMEGTRELVDHLLTTHTAFGRPFGLETAAEALDSVDRASLAEFARSVGVSVPAFACVGPNHASEFAPVDPGWVAGEDDEGREGGEPNGGAGKAEHQEEASAGTLHVMNR